MSFLKVLTSVLSGFLGVRPAKGAESDFAQGKLWPYVLVGIVCILLFIGVLVVVVQQVLASSI